VVTLMVEVRFTFRIPTGLEEELAGDPTVSDLDRRYSTLTFTTKDGPGIQRRIYDWTQQTCMVEGEVTAIKVTRIGP
jgi:hypothetical protein